MAYGHCNEPYRKLIVKMRCKLILKRVSKFGNVHVLSYSFSRVHRSLPALATLEYADHTRPYLCLYGCHYQPCELHLNTVFLRE